MTERIVSIESASPELRFAAALVADALDASRNGDPEAYRWLEHCSRPWIDAVTPDTVNTETIHEALLRMAAPTKPWQGRLFDEEAA